MENFLNFVLGPLLFGGGLGFQEGRVLGACLERYVRGKIPGEVCEFG